MRLEGGTHVLVVRTVHWIGLVNWLSGQASCAAECSGVWITVRYGQCWPGAGRANGPVRRRQGVGDGLSLLGAAELWGRTQ